MTVLLADIGGTNSRCALADATGRLGTPRLYRNADFAGPLPLLADFLGSLDPAQRPTTAALAIAAPIRGDEVRMINIDWHFSIGALGRGLALEPLHVLNDFEALAWALPALGAADLLAIGDGVSDPGAPRLVLGPGTGLGVASLVPTRHGAQVIPGEGGHVTLAASDATEERVIAAARARFGHCSAERLLSGSGLSFLHQALHGGRELTATALGARITAGDAAAHGTLELFFRLLGTVAGNAALTVGAAGGVWIGGGIVPRYAQLFQRSGFRARFEAKGRYRPYMQVIPTWLITAPHPALAGLLAFRDHAGRGETAQ